MSPILVYLDRMMIAALISLQAVTIYTIPTEIFNRMGILPSCLMATLFPAFSGHGAVSSGRAQLNRLFGLTTKYLLLVFLPLFAYLVVNASDILTVWMGEHFAREGTLVLQVLACGALLNFLARLPFASIQALGRPDVTGKLHLFELPLYIVLCLLLIPRWGILGAAVACAVRVSLDAFLMFGAAYKHYRLHPTWSAEVGRLLAVGAILLALLGGVHNGLHGEWPRLLAGAVLVAMCYLTIWLFVLNDDDRPALVGVLRPAREEAAR
jgi:O-antigen/teichoic acid export membrane protein